MLDRLKWVQVVPILLLLFAAWVYRGSESEARIQLSRAKEWWRQGRLQEAIGLYESIHQTYPASGRAPEALWELASIYYFKYQQVSRGATYYERLVRQYPNWDLAREARLRLGDIYENDLDDLPRAVEQWEEILQNEPGPDLRFRLLYRLGNASFKMNEFDLASQRLVQVLQEGAPADLAQQARLLLATIHQVEGRYEESVRLFNEVVSEIACPDCRLHARLGLIQSYEFLDDLAQAIRVARAIPAGDLTVEMKRDLIRRLEEKEKFSR